MTTTQTDATTAAVDPATLMDFVFRSVGEVGGALGCALAVMGDELGYYAALAEHGPLTPASLARLTDTSEHYAREWLGAQAAGAVLTYDPADGRFTLPPEQAVALTDPTSPAYLIGLFQITFGTIKDASRIIELARDGAGLGWHEHNTDVHLGCERFFAPSYRAHLVADWLPALDGAVAKLERGARVADIGCGHGASTVLMAHAFPRSTFFGSDYHDDSVKLARARAREAGVAERVAFESTPAAGFTGSGYDLVTTFDALHDMGDPLGASRRVHAALADDGSWMVVEPAAGDHLEDNLNPVGRAYYGFSTLLCTPASLSQEVGLAIGTQAGPAKVREIVQAAGFATCEVVAQTPFHNVLEVRK